MARQDTVNRAKQANNPDRMTTENGQEGAEASGAGKSPSKRKNLAAQAIGGEGDEKK